MRKWIIKRIIKGIKNADAETIDYILDAAIQRKRELYPDWELFYCAAPKDAITSPEEMVGKAQAFERKLRAKYE